MKTWAQRKQELLTLFLLDLTDLKENSKSSCFCREKLGRTGKKLILLVVYYLPFNTVKFLSFAYSTP